MDTTHIDLFALIGGEFEKKASTDGGEFAGACPFCGGEDRFLIWPTPDAGNPRFWCRQCKASGDAIEFIMRRDNLAFPQAVECLNLQPQMASRDWTARQKQISRPVRSEKDYAALHDSQWQASAATFCTEASNRLWSNQGEIALKYLRARGLADQSIRDAQLGYSPKGMSQKWGEVNVWLYSGIVIPWMIDGQYWKVNIRRRPSELRNNDKRYQQAKGGANALYRADAVYPGCTVVITEGEFDALCVCSNVQELSDIVPVATGSTGGAQLLAWVATVAKADRVFIAFDADDAGDQAAKWWLDIFGDKASRLRPLLHDVSDMVQADKSLVDWIKSAA